METSIEHSARARGLADALPLIAQMELPEPAPADPTLDTTVGADPLAALDVARRRGLDPRVVEVFYKWFEKRPLELGLFAWDVLCNSLLHDERDALLLAKLRKAARVVREVLPEPGRAFADTKKVSAHALVEKIAIPAFQALGDEEQFQVAQVNGLAALEVNLVVSEPGDKDLLLALETARRFAHYLQLAKLPTLATFYFDFLHRRGGAPVGDYLEAMLDADAHGHLPDRAQLVKKGTIDELELIGYLLGRNAVQLDTAESMISEFRKAPNPIDYAKAKPQEIAKTFQRSHLVHAELFLEEGDVPVPFAVVDEVARLHPSWRYAARVRTALGARVAKPDSAEPLALLDQFLATFGNERFMWATSWRAALGESQWLGGVRERLVREVAALPHDRAAWEALAAVNLVSDDQPAWMQAIGERVAAQCAL